MLHITYHILHITYYTGNKLGTNHGSPTPKYCSFARVPFLFRTAHAFPHSFCAHIIFVHEQVTKNVIKGRTSKHVNSYEDSNLRTPAVSITSNATYSEYVHVLRTCTYARDRLRRSARTPVTRVHQVERPMTDVILAQVTGLRKHPAFLCVAYLTLHHRFTKRTIRTTCTTNIRARTDSTLSPLAWRVD